MSKQWLHAPVHWLFQPGIYMVTAGTHRKEPYFNTPARRDALLELLHTVAVEFKWRLQAWAVMANHYHVVAATDQPDTLPDMMAKLHAVSARQINREDSAPGRKVWFQYWESHITFERSWLARLHYVQTNPVHHGVAQRAEDYPWCSAAAFATDSNRSFVNTVNSTKIDQVCVPDDF
jgi:putative transposase